MSKEWSEAKDCTVFPVDYKQHVVEILPNGQEIYTSETEYVLPVEYYEFETEKMDSVQKKEKSHKKRMRKILYGIASMVMTISLGRTAAEVYYTDGLMVETSAVTSEQNIEVFAENVPSDMEVGNEAEEIAEEIELEQNEVMTSAESSVVEVLSLWNHTTDNWKKVYYQTEKDGEWLETDWDFEIYGVIQSGDGPTLENVALNEHYFAVKALTESNQEKVWTYDLVFGENHEYYNGTDEVTYVEPDWYFLQLDMYDNHTSIYWTYSDGTAR